MQNPRQVAIDKFDREQDVLYERNGQAYSAIIQNDISYVEMLLKTGGLEQGVIGHFIFDVKSVDMLKLFLRFGGDVHKPGPPGNPEPFHLLRSIVLDKSNEKSRVMKLIKFLIEQGIDLNSVDHDGYTPFLRGAQEGLFSICKLLVEKGADFTAIRTSNYTTALHIAAQNGHLDICRYLVEDLGFDIESFVVKGNGAGMTALGFAAGNGWFDFCKYLLQNGAKVDNGLPLMLAAGVL